MLHQHPDVHKRVLLELDDALGTKTPTYNMLKSLPYLEAVLFETLRLYPSVPNDTKFAIKRDTLPDGTVIPAGANVSYSPYSFGRSKRFYPDPEKFLPERWLLESKSGKIKFKEVWDQFHYIQFNAGK